MAAPEPSVLAIQTESETRTVLEHGLGYLGFVVDASPDVERSIRAARTGQYGLVLLDLVLPGYDGFDVLEEICELQPHLPVIVLTALGGVDNRVRGLEAGAVDYVLKPFSLEELTARIRAQLRQADATRMTHLAGAGIDVDLLNRTAFHQGVPIHFTTMEFRLLVYLMQRPGVTHSRRDIFREVWGEDLDNGRNLVDVYVGYLRRKLRVHEAYQRDMPIQTVRSRGYRFAGIGDGVSSSRL